jgi:Uma2 family endonuclease
MELILKELPLPVRLRFPKPTNDEELFRFCARNGDLRIEREPGGEILVMSPASSKTSQMKMRIGRLLDEWAEADGRGVAFDSSGGFTLPDGSMRNPDAAWVLRIRWDALTQVQQSSFAPVSPDFVIELRSPTDGIADVREKMRMWVSNGTEVPWLIDPERRAVEIYRPRDPFEQLHDPGSVQGTDPVAGFELVMARVWQ